MRRTANHGSARRRDCSFVTDRTLKPRTQYNVEQIKMRLSAWEAGQIVVPVATIKPREMDKRLPHEKSRTRGRQAARCSVATSRCSEVANSRRAASLIAS